MNTDQVICRAFDAHHAAALATYEDAAERSDWINERVEQLTASDGSYEPSDAMNASEALADASAAERVALTTALRARDRAEAGRLLMDISVAYWDRRAEDKATDEYDGNFTEIEP
jgi:hypothetical protein